MVALLTWISAHSGHSAPDRLPDVVAMSQAEFELYFCEQMERCEAPGRELGVLAVFEFETQTVYMHEGFAPQDLEHQSTMVRQLVHFLQALEGSGKGCRGLLVQEARQVESRWRVAHGLPPLPVTPLGMLLEACGPGPT
jgi:hypothetical protein